MVSDIRLDIKTCVRCDKVLSSSMYELLLEKVRSPHCLPCAMQFRPMLKRSFVIGLIVGTMLTGINQGDLLLSGNLQSGMAWKIPMTYAVPFIVATVGGLLNARTSV